MSGDFLGQLGPRLRQRLERLHLGPLELALEPAARRLQLGDQLRVAHWHRGHLAERREVHLGARLGMGLVGKEARTQDREAGRNSIQLEIIVLALRERLPVAISGVGGQAEIDRTIAVGHGRAARVRALLKQEWGPLLAQIDEGEAAANRLGAVDDPLLCRPPPGRARAAGCSSG